MAMAGRILPQFIIGGVRVSSPNRRRHSTYKQSSIPEGLVWGYSNNIAFALSVITDVTVEFSSNARKISIWDYAVFILGLRA